MRLQPMAQQFPELRITCGIRLYRSDTLGQIRLTVLLNFLSSPLLATLRHKSRQRNPQFNSAWPFFTDKICLVQILNFCILHLQKHLQVSLGCAKRESLPTLRLHSAAPCSLNHYVAFRDSITLFKEMMCFYSSYTELLLHSNHAATLTEEYKPKAVFLNSLLP